MTTKYCPNCGTGHECEAETAMDAEKAAVAIARLETQRDIRIAELQAGAAKHIADVEAEGEADHLEGVIEGAELVAGGGEPDGDEAGEPIVVQVDGGGDVEETADVEEPPVVEPVMPAEPKAPGWWSAYR